MVRSILFLCTLQLILSCVGKPLVYQPYEIKSEDQGKRPGQQASCRSWESFVRDTLYAKVQPVRRIRVHVHYVDRTDSCCSFRPGRGEAFAANMLYAANNSLSGIHSSNLPLGNSIEALPKHYRYQLERDKNGRPKVYYHYDDDLYYYIHKGPHKNNYDRTVINKYRTGGDTTMNIFILPHHPDSLLQPDYKPRITGIALGRDMKIAGVIENGKNWEARGVLNHETGHILGLRHTWRFDDGCEDTPHHSNCWNYTKSPPCDSMVSNNMMDYNAYQNALTPCQIGKIQERFAKQGVRQRNILIKDWCKLDTTSVIVIRDSARWDAPLDLDRSIHIRSGGSLTISCRISMPPGSRISVDPGGTFILDQGWLYNDCGSEWEGIYMGTRGQDSGQIKLNTPYRIDDVNDYLPEP